MRIGQWFRLFLSHPRVLLFGLLHNFFGGFGQTYLLAYFIGSFQNDFELSYTDVGFLSMYMSLGSALSLPYFGRLLDRVHVGNYSFITSFFLLSGCYIIASAPSIHFLFIGLYLVRLCAHGLMTHISDVSISRYFTEDRGKALSISGIGGSFGEAFLPLIVVQLLSHYHWRHVYEIMAFSIACILLPVALFLVQRKSSFHFPPKEDRSSPHSSPTTFSYKKLFSSPYFLSTLIMIMVPPFLITGFLFYQSALAQFKGWEISVMGSFLIGFAIFRLSFGILAGALTDRFSGRRLFPFYTLPLASGLLIMLFMKTPLGALIFFCLAGATLGLGTNFKGVIWVELYGRQKVATIRSISTTAMVISTALSPPLFGRILDASYPFSILIQASIAFIIFTASIHYLISTRYEQTALN